MSNETKIKPRRTRRMAREAKTVETASEATATNAPTTSASEQNTSNTAPPTKRPSKIDQLIALLQRDEGATLEEMVEATGWQKHTVRAALTGLRKKGYAIGRGKRGEVTCYHAQPAA